MTLMLSPSRQDTLQQRKWQEKKWCAAASGAPQPSLPQVVTQHFAARHVGRSGRVPNPRPPSPARHTAAYWPVSNVSSKTKCPVCLVLFFSLGRYHRIFFFSWEVWVDVGVKMLAERWLQPFLHRFGLNGLQLSCVSLVSLCVYVMHTHLDTREGLLQLKSGVASCFSFFMKCHCLFMILIDLFQTLLGCSLKYDILWWLLCNNA